MAELSEEAELELQALHAIYGDEIASQGDNAVTVTVIPGVRLHLNLPPSYPGGAMPQHFLECSAATLSDAARRTIRQEFDRISSEEDGGVVCYAWIEWLREYLQSMDLPSSADGLGDTASRADDQQDTGDPDAQPAITIYSGPPVTDRKSKFIAHVARITCPDEVEQIVTRLLQDRKIAVATHPVMRAFRVTVDGVVHEDRDDDGEHGAGDTLLYLMQRLDVMDAVVVVTRWYGGIQLGPDRFKHISNQAKQVLLAHDMVPGRQQEQQRQQSGDSKVRRR